VTLPNLPNSHFQVSSPGFTLDWASRGFLYGVRVLVDQNIDIIIIIIMIVVVVILYRNSLTKAIIHIME